MRNPSLVAFTRYAERRLAQRGLSRRQVADLVLSEHPRRRRNPREADWIVRGEGTGVAYNWPDRGDQTAALVVTVWAE